MPRHYPGDGMVSRRPSRSLIHRRRIDDRTLVGTIVRKIRWSFHSFIEPLHHAPNCPSSPHLWPTKTQVCGQRAPHARRHLLHCSWRSFYTRIVAAGTASYECPFQIQTSIGLRNLRDSETTRKPLEGLPRSRSSRSRAPLRGPPAGALFSIPPRQRRHTIPAILGDPIPHILSGIHGTSAKVEYQIILRIARDFENAGQRSVQGIRRFRHAVLLPTATEDVRRQPPVR